MEERLRQAELRLKGALQEVATLRAGAQDVAGAQREAALLEQQLSQVHVTQSDLTLHGLTRNRCCAAEPGLWGCPTGLPS